MLRRFTVTFLFAFWALAAVSASPVLAQSLTTTFADNNGASGNYFDVVVGAKPLTVQTISVNTTSAMPAVSVYTRVGTINGNTGGPAGWTLVGTINATGAGVGNPTVVDIPDFVLPANATTGFFVFITGGGLRYTNGTAVGNIAAQNADLQILEGHGTINLLAGGLFTTRIWNGTITYTGGFVAAVATPATVPAPAPTAAKPKTLKKTHQTIARYLSRRNDQLLTSGPGAGRQIDRLMDAQGGDNNGGTGAEYTHNGNRLASSNMRDDAQTDSKSHRARRSALGGPDAQAGPTRSFGFGGDGLSSQDRWNEGQTASAIPFGFTVQGDRGERKSFSTSLTQMAKAAAAAKRAKLGGGNANLQKLGVSSIDGVTVAEPRQLGLDIWVEGQLAHFEEGADGRSRDGDFGVLHVGADYVVTPNILIGALVQFDSMEDRSNDLQTDVTGRGWMIGPYATVRLSDNVFVQGRAAWGESDVKISPFLTYTDRYDTTRWLVDGSIQGRWAVGGFFVSPHASVSYVEEDQKAYTDSLGVFIPGQRVSLGQARIGPQVSFKHEAQDGTLVEPYGELEAIWNFDESTSGVVAGALAGNEEWRGKAGLGIKLTATTGVSLDISGYYDGIGADELDVVSGDLTLRLPLN